MSFIDNTKAAYRVLDERGFFSDDDTLYKEGDEIYFDGTPNEQLEPLNQIAHDRLTTYLEELDQLGREAAVKAGRPYNGRPRTLDGGLALASAVQKAEMGVMGASQKQKAATTENIAEQAVHDTGLNIAKRGRGRPLGSSNKKQIKISEAA